jgi:hypothetical protein
MIEYKARAFDADLQELARRLQKCVAVDDGQMPMRSTLGQSGTKRSPNASQPRMSWYEAPASCDCDALRREFQVHRGSLIGAPVCLQFVDDFLTFAEYADTGSLKPVAWTNMSLPPPTG